MYLWWILLLTFWGVINFMAGLYVITRLEIYRSNWEVFFPVQGYLIDRAEDYTLAGKIIIMGLGSVFFLPFTAVVLVASCIMAFFWIVSQIFNMLFKKDGEEK